MSLKDFIRRQSMKRKSTWSGSLKKLSGVFLMIRWQAWFLKKNLMNIKKHLTGLQRLLELKILMNWLRISLMLRKETLPWVDSLMNWLRKLNSSISKLNKLRRKLNSTRTKVSEKTMRERSFRKNLKKRFKKMKRSMKGI